MVYSVSWDQIPWPQTSWHEICCSRYVKLLQEYSLADDDTCRSYMGHNPPANGDWVAGHCFMRLNLRRSLELFLGSFVHAVLPPFGRFVKKAFVCFLVEYMRGKWAMLFPKLLVHACGGRYLGHKSELSLFSQNSLKLMNLCSPPSPGSEQYRWTLRYLKTNSCILPCVFFNESVNLRKTLIIDRWRVQKSRSWAHLNDSN